ncbi:MAG TPA: NADH-quinone oxidoreductase subunit C [Vicinamibacterales bacterium]|nr:NADH-quinone oxidoreductase subunit C [Vicinamibacterales bacterium]
MADDAQKPPTPPEAAADKPAGATPAEPLKGEVSRTDAPGAGVSAAPVGPPRTEPPAPKPTNVEGAVTATTSETSSATGQPTAPAAAVPAKPAPAASAAAPKAAAKPAAPAAKPAAPAAHAGADHVPKAAAPTGPTDPPPPADAQTPAFVASLQAAIPDGVLGLSLYLGDWTIMVPPAKLLDVARHLHDAPDARFDYLSDLTATDWPPRTTEGRFDVVYMLYSIRLRQRVRLKVKVGDGQPLASVTGIWPAANWLEREVYDMFGVNFTGHPDRRRILMPEDWQGFPQRKDYPLEGPGELLMENPLDWLKLRQAKEEAEIE